MSQSDNSDSKPGKRQNFQFFSSPGEKVGPELMPIEGVDETVAAAIAGINSLVEGSEVRCLFRQPETDGPSLVYGWFKSGYVLPRHSHSADCLYYVLAGELRAGSRIMRKGDGVFVPAGAGYAFEAGPEGAEFLEFRTRSNFNFLFLNNDQAHWERIRQVDRERLPGWANETVPPSQRVRAAE
jgi:mannose-6-phosphate isomerase-like protein (cupin superfamily)